MQPTMSNQGIASPAEPLSSTRERAPLLRRLVIGTAGFAVVLFLLVSTLVADSFLYGSVFLAAVLVMCGVVYLLVQRGDEMSAVRSYAYGLLVIGTLSALIYGGMASPALFGYFIPVLVVGLLGTTKEGWWAAGLAALCACIILLAHLSITWIPVYEATTTFVGALLNLVVLLGVGLIVVFLSWSFGHDMVSVLHESSSRASELLVRSQQLEEKNMQQVELGSELSAAAAELQMTSQQQASGATQQASAVSEVSTTVEELGATARQIAQASDHVAQAAQQTLEHLSNGQVAVDENVQAMERIRSRMQDISARVLSLGERSHQIGEIINLINNISDETHLLALNAAIEAAGAGEHGRRFAVVAAEVKSLANRTLAAAKEVQGVIAEIRQATNAAVLAAEEGGKEVELGAELAYRAGQVMDTILMMAERTAQSASEIGMATAQQQSASEQVVEAMREIAEVARQSASGSRQMAESSAMLTAIADRLNGVNQRLKEL